MFSFVSMRIIQINKSLRRWSLTDMYVKSPIPQTGLSKRYVYVKPSRESSDRGRCEDSLNRLLPFVKLKLQMVSFLRQDPHLHRVLAGTAPPAALSPFKLWASRRNHRQDCRRVATGWQFPYLRRHRYLYTNRTELATIVHGPGYLWYLGLTLHQNRDLSTCVSGDDNLNCAFFVALSILRRRDWLSPLTSVESKVYESLN